MFVKKVKNPDGRIRLAIVQSYRVNGKNKSRMIKNLGYLENLEKQYNDPIAHFKEIAKQMTEEYNETHGKIAIKIDKDEVLAKNVPNHSNRKNLGYAAISKIYHDLEIDYFVNNHRRYNNEKFNHNSILKLLVFDRILFPSSKKGAFENKSLFFEKMDFSLNDIYRSLSFFNKHSKELLMAINKRIKLNHKRSTSLVYYDVTNYYFEIDQEDLDEDIYIDGEKSIKKGFRKKGVSKEHRPEPIVQMGLFMDDKGIPITYNTYSGNTNDCKTLIPSLMDIRYDYDMKDVIVVADKGMMTGDNLSRILAQKNGYVISYSIRKAKKDFQSYVLNQKDYINEYDSNGNLAFKYKSRIFPREITVHSLKDGTPIKMQINERQIIFYSKKYADRAKKDRAKAVEKAYKIIQDPNRKKKPANRGSAKYIEQFFFGENGEIINDYEKALGFNFEFLENEEKLDGYYAICTNVIGLAKSEKKFKDKSRITKDGFFQLNKEVSAKDIIDIYRGLWKIEETFKVTKSSLKTRPVYLWKREHIEAHFLICFLSLVILRLLEYRLKGKYSAARISESLSLASGSYLADGFYHFNYYDDLLEDIGNELGIDYSRKYLKLGEIRKMLGDVKKTNS